MIGILCLINGHWKALAESLDEKNIMGNVLAHLVQDNFQAHQSGPTLLFLFFIFGFWYEAASCPQEPPPPTSIPKFFISKFFIFNF